MKRSTLLALTIALGMGAVSISAQPLPDLSRKAARKADQKLSIEGEWIFTLGDFFFDDSSNEIIEYELKASFYPSGYLFFEEADESILPMAAQYNDETGELSFPMGKLGDFYGYGNLVQLPSFLVDPEAKTFSYGEIKAHYDAAKGVIEFPENAAMQWWLYDYSDMPMFSLDIYTILEVRRKPTKRANSIIINKGKDSETQLSFSEFSRIDFKEGQAVFNNAENLSLPLTQLYTMHFEEKSVTTAVGENFAERQLQFNWVNNQLTVAGVPSDAPLDIYTVSGAKVFSAPRYNGETVDLGMLQPGIYIVNAGGSSFKLLKK